jgi:hypothetical protein
MHISKLNYSVRHVPEWVPGAGFKKKAREWKKIVDDMHQLPFDEAKSKYDAGSAVPSFTTKWLDDSSAVMDEKERAALEVRIRDVAGVSYIAGFETVRIFLFSHVRPSFPILVQVIFFPRDFFPCDGDVP